MRPKFVFLLTVQHTGTWWTINTLRKHPDITGFVHVRNVLRHYQKQPLIGIDEGNPHGECLSETGINLAHTHWFHIYEKGRWQWDTFNDAFVVAVPTLMPLRDPLLSLLTRHNRDSWMYPHTDLLDEWVRLAASELPISYFKMDEFSTAEFATALSAVGLSTQQEWLNKIDRNTLHNTSGSYYLKDAYYARDVKSIEATVPVLWKYLKQAELQLRPFLEERGYKNLMWCS